MQRISPRIVSCHPRWCLAALLLCTGTLQAEEQKIEAALAQPTEFSAADLEHFEKRIRPLLHKHCYECHSGDAKVLQGGLRLDGRDLLLTGGDSGPALVPGKPDQSLLIEAIRYQGTSFDMPPGGKLSDHEIRLLEDWVARGAPFPGGSSLDVAPQKSINYDEGRKFWSFQPLARQEPPPRKQDQWSRAKIDPFILAKLEEHGLTPSPAAARATLIRRLSFNLIGLPPTPEEIAQFVNDTSPNAYEQLVDRLLASPHYGERWGRMWLDLARYSDTTESWLGATTHAHLYRDWVIRAFNEDLPYDQFVRRQLATDMLEETGLEDLPALGFLGLSPTYFKELLLPPDIIKVIVADEWEERVDAVGRTFLGLTLACARCHDHKFDPISTEDYYALAGVFASTRMTQRPMIPDEQYAPVATAKATVAELKEQLQKLGKAKPKPADEIAALEQKIKEIETSTPDYHTPMAHVVEDESLYVELAGSDPQSGTKLVHRPEPQNLNLFIRGNPNRLGPVIPRRFLTVLSPGEPEAFQQGSGRLELAQAILNDAGPLTARVIVNRVWQGHFGRGLVDTPSNFGRLGSPPTHPELLEDLTARFVENGWSLKWLHREIVLSATYQQASSHDGQKFAIDPDNHWLWRMNRRRLDVEPWRDAMLAVSGQLDLSQGGPGLPLDELSNHRRTIYGTIHRREISKTLAMHDFPDPGLHSPQRINTTTPLQGLFLLNSPFVMEQARVLAARLQQEQPASLPDRVQRAHQLVFGRDATPAEVQLAREYIPDKPNSPQTPDSISANTAEPESSTEPVSPPEVDAAWVRYAHALLASNEFLFID
ncbi:MAG: PSD1 domain-containing protein [Planctomycetaceae bacterium]|nr:PSD1 domain-containing protein [Planctomycetaceae bacterium]